VVYKVVVERVAVGGVRVLGVSDDDSMGISVDKCLSEIYFIDPVSLSEKLIHTHRHRGNCFDAQQPQMNRADCVIRWDALKEDIQRAGFNRRCPIQIDIKENILRDGNHRFALALELDLDYVPVQFLWYNATNIVTQYEKI